MGCTLIESDRSDGIRFPSDSCKRGWAWGWGVGSDTQRGQGWMKFQFPSSWPQHFPLSPDYLFSRHQTTCSVWDVLHFHKLKGLRLLKAIGRTGSEIRQIGLICWLSHLPLCNVPKSLEFFFSASVSSSLHWEHESYLHNGIHVMS